MNDKIRPIYRELQAYLAQAPSLISNSDITRDRTLWVQFNGLVDELNAVTSENWNRFKISDIKHGQVTQHSVPYQYISVSEYRSKVNGLIERLYGTYFTNELAPFGTTPGTIINQNQSQSQTTHVQILLDFQSKLDEKIKNYADGSKEKTFLEKIRGALSKIGDVSELFSLILRTGKDIGLTIEDVFRIFS